MRFTKTVFGWEAYRRVGRAYVYFGHFRSQARARAALALVNHDFSKD
jgi:hypothetical protein